jgi:hypothetical protein
VPSRHEDAEPSQPTRLVANGRFPQTGLNRSRQVQERGGYVGLIDPANGTTRQTYGPAMPLPEDTTKAFPVGSLRASTASPKPKHRPRRPTGPASSNRANQGQKAAKLKEEMRQREIIRDIASERPESGHPDPETNRYCDANRTDPKAKGLKCRQPAGYRTDHQGWGRCAQHGGNTVAGIREAEIERAAALEAQRRIDLSTLQRNNALNQLYRIVEQITPEDALEQELWRTQGAISELQKRISQMELADLEKTAEGRQIKDLWLGERNRIVKIAKTMLEIDLKDRQTTAAEALSGVIVSAVTNIVSSLRLSPEQAELVGPAIREHLTLMAASDSASQIGQDVPVSGQVLR